jgi:prolyl oligopeptidase
MKSDERLKYPEARVVDEQDTAAGVTFPDPYRWLEEETDETADWQKAQNAVTDDFVHSWPHYDRLLELVDHHVADGNGSPNWMVDPPLQFAGGRWFQLDRPTATKYPDRAVVTVSDSPGDPGRVIFDPNATPGQQVTWFVPSPNGQIVALGIASDGQELAEIQLLDVDSGERLPDRIPQKTVGPLVTPQWLGDSTGFFYTAGVQTADVFTFEAFFHELGTPPPTQPEPVGVPDDAPVVQVAADGRHAVATSVWTLPRFVCDLPQRNWRPFVQGVDAAVCGVIDGDRYVAVTNHGAPRGRLVAIPLDSSTPADADSWQELVPESERVLHQVRLIGGRLVVIGSLNAEARAWVFDLNGQELEEVPLPPGGAMPHDILPHAGLVPSGHPEEFVFHYSSPSSSPGVYRYRLGTDHLEILRSPRVTMPDVTVELRNAVSADGTRVPYHLVSPHNRTDSPSLPTLITAYGGGSVSWPAQYPGPLATFVASGGALAISHQRGGSDLGSDWADAGRLEDKQNSYDDLFAVAEDLISNGLSSPEQLTMTGWSSGGLTAGVAVTQRPDLWAAVVAQCPILDVIGSHRHPYGKLAIASDYGDLDDPAEVSRLATISPYHLIESDVDYPWFYVHAGAVDMACPPGQIRKFSARLQSSVGNFTPALLRVWDGVGHGTSSSRSEGVLHTTHWLAFLMRRLGMTPPE